MIYVDAHCDTLTKLSDSGGDILDNSFHADLERMLEYKGFVQFFASFIPPAAGQAYSLRYGLKLIDVFYRQLEKYPDRMSLCLSYNDIQKSLESGRVAAVLSIEDGVLLQGETAVLRMLYRLGIRSICLTWNHSNEIADGVFESDSGGGLTIFGKQTVQEMNRLGMIIDVSHLSEKGFWDVMECSNQPVIASHSNVKSLCSHPRNLTDKQIKAIARKGGVIGINFCPDFLSSSNPGIDTITAHIGHIVSIAGEDTVGFGSDFDGIGSLPEGLTGVQDMRKVSEKLLKMNYNEETVRKIAGLNFLRVMKKILK